ncbi:MAG: hypothetical protein RLZZ346_648, partial [Cyanobacteriota bacterium]
AVMPGELANMGGDVRDLPWRDRRGRL